MSFHIMATMNKFFVTFFLLGLAALGICCKNEDILINQYVVDPGENGKPVVEVAVFNRLKDCTISNLVLSCEKFQSTIPPDPATLQVARDGRCLVGQGKPIATNLSVPVVFRYAWTLPVFKFNVVSCTPDCSPNANATVVPLPLPPTISIGGGDDNN